MFDPDTEAMRAHLVFDADFCRLRARHYYRLVSAAGPVERDALLECAVRLEAKALELDSNDRSGAVRFARSAALRRIRDRADPGPVLPANAKPLRSA
jgi:hypothetical protein